MRPEIKFIKVPEDIDEAVYHVVNYIQTRIRHQFHDDRKRKFVRRSGSGSENEKDHEEEDEAVSLTKEFNNTNKKSPYFFLLFLN